jgi:chromate transport protein ChrA
MLFDVVIGLFRNATDKSGVYPYIIMVLAFLYVRLTGFSIVWLVLGCIAAGVAKALLVKRGEERR